MTRIDPYNPRENSFLTWGQTPARSYWLPPHIAPSQLDVPATNRSP